MIRLLALGFWLFSAPALASTWGLEADLASPALNAVSGSREALSSLSARWYLYDRFHLSLDVMTTGEDESDGSFVGVSPLIRPTAHSSYTGLGAGYYFSGYDQDSFRIGASFGAADRLYRASGFDFKDSHGFFRHFEVGYQWVFGNARVAALVGNLHSDLPGTVRFTNDQGEIVSTFRNDFSTAKILLGVTF